MAVSVSRPAASPRLTQERRSLLAGCLSSLFLHALLLALGFATLAPGLRKERDTGLQVVLVNARHAHAPKSPQALAQANLDGGGEQADRKLMPASPLPAQESVRQGEALIEMQQRREALEQRQRELIAQARAAQAHTPRDPTPQQSAPPVPTDPARPGLDMETARAIARQEAIVERAIADYAARPRKGVIAPSTREYVLAQYGEDWRIKVQRVGELNFPRDARGSLYGTVQVAVDIDPEGRLLNAEISRPSTNPKINDAALRILRLAAPFAPFPPDVRKRYEILQIVRTLNFTRDDIGVSSQ